MTTMAASDDLLPSAADCLKTIALAEAEKDLATLRDAGATSRPGSFDQGAQELRQALYDGELFAVGELKAAEGPLEVIEIPSTVWGSGAKIVRNLVTAPWGDVYRNVRRRETDLHRIWLQQEDRTSEPAGFAHSEAADFTDDSVGLVIPSGVRTNKAAAAEEACEEWIAGLSEQPENKDAAFEDAEKNVAPIGPLSRKAFERAWDKRARPEWKRPGRRKQAPP